MRVLHLPTDVGGNAYGLSRGERAHGLKSDALVAYGTHLKYPCDKLMYDTPSRHKAEYYYRRFNVFLEFLKIRTRYDIYHFNFGTTLLNADGKGQLVDLPFYGRKNSRIVVTYNGCDARLKYMTMKRAPVSACHQPDCYGGMCNDGNYDRLRRERMHKFDRYADAIFALNPDLCWILPKRTVFLPYTIASWNQVKPISKPDRDKKAIRIVHAPTNRACKGSDHVINAFAVIKKRYGNLVETKIIEGMSNSNALKEYAAADLVVDQLLVGWYGAVSVEVMKMGIPVLVYIRKEDLRFIPSAMARDCENAFIIADPETLIDTLCAVVENKKILKKKREAALDYVHQWHDPRRVADSTRKTYLNILDSPPHQQTSFQ